ncbi:cytochrome D1 domain-containing protein [Thiohalomonas denitrificans]|uniref:cytochrome D1 domain-containing protein n=1 Tax=Thiohalomonas denitrificans TaxID=415747 RepID=UPI0026F33401|nr:cytochrome D1 domain-containing protein [Thiohalomonas denitrificans]
MKRLLLTAAAVLLASAVRAETLPGENPGTEELFQQHCAACHGTDRLGGTGPALLPENLKRLRPKAAARVIAEGRAATQMPGFADKLSEAETASLAEYVYTPLPEVPRWRMAEIRDSHIVHNPLHTLSDTPVFSADMLNLFVVVEVGDHHATILDGDSFKPIHRFPTRFALHGGPKYSRDGRFVYFASRDGWITKYDIYNLKPVAEIRVGINTRNIAVSADDRYIMAANYLPHTLVVLDARNLEPVRVIDAVGSDGTSSRVSAVYTARPRNSFVAALKDIPEVWEISYLDEPPNDYAGWTHDYRKESGDLEPADRFPKRRITVHDYLDDFFFDQDYEFVIGTSRKGTGQVVNLDTSRVVSELEIPGMPHLSSGITWNYRGRTVMATPNLKEAEVSVIDMESWESVARIPTLGSGFFMRSHENTPYAWVDVFFGEHRDAMHVIDKQSLKIVKTLRPAPGKTAAHVEFTRDGRYALVSIWDMDGAIVVYDAKTLEEVKRIPMVKPSGKYNVWNKTRLSEGTSH